MASNTPQATIKDLILQHIAGTISPVDAASLDQWVTADPENLVLFAELTDPIKVSIKLSDLSRIEARLAANWPKVKEAGEKRHNATRKGWWAYPRHWLAAAAVLLAVAATYTTWRLTDKDSARHPAVVVASTPADILPGSSKARLTLADGRIVDLSLVGYGKVADEGTTAITKTADGALVYGREKAGSGPLAYNQISTPRGGQYRVTLPDGTTVLLNASSSLRYPAAFPDSTRDVELSGEAYFEVAKNRVSPFRVKLRDNMRITVTGTHFTVASYPDEPVTKTTLLEGGVRVSKEAALAVLRPGQQAIAGTTQDLKVQAADIARETAWINGSFDFYNEQLSAVMRQVSRWYDVDVTFSGVEDRRLSFALGRNVPLSKLLDILEETGQVSFKITGRSVTVLPASY